MTDRAGVLTMVGAGNTARTSPSEATMTTLCTTCGHTPDRPYRVRTADGTVVAGCVSAAHDDHADAWHVRLDAAFIRATPKAWADTLVL